MKYYVYHAYGISNELLYVGKGSGGRLRHCNSGTSHCLELNRYFFEKGSNAIKVEIIKRFETDEEALNYERFCIISLQPLFNKDMNVDAEGKNYKVKITDIQTRLRAGYQVDFGKMMKLYLGAIQKNDTEFVNCVNVYSPHHKQCLDVLGLVKIKRIGYNKTKLITAMNSKLKFNENNYLIKQNLSGVFIGERYTLSIIINLLQHAYDKVCLDKKVKSTDIKNYFNVQDVWMTIDGKRCKGYLILEDLYKEVQYED